MHTLPFLAAPIPAASTLSWMQTGPSHAATPASVHLESFARPVFHNGLPRSVQTFRSDEPSPRGLPKAAQSQPVSPARLVQSMHPHVAASSADMGGARYRDDPPSLYEGRSWERDSGAPKRASRESDCQRLEPACATPSQEPNHSTPHRRRADSLPSIMPECPPQTVNALPPGHGCTPRSPRTPLSKLQGDARERTSSGSERQLAARRAGLRRPSLLRASSHHELGNIVEGKVSSADCSCTSKKAHALPSLPEPNSPYRKLGRGLHTPQSPPGLSLATPSPSAMSSRPPPLRRHTHQLGDRRNEMASRSDLMQSSSQPVSRLDDCPQHTPAPSPGSRDIDRYDLKSLAGTLPSASHTTKQPSHRLRRESIGYVHPLSHDGYDRYTAHPATPCPARTAREQPGTSTTTRQSTPLPPPMTEYRPMGYAPLTRAVPWNRDGPAMKTHGVAWKKHTEGLVLPQGPAGPRWQQAGPPRAEAVVGGGWWESGGQGH